MNLTPKSNEMKETGALLGSGRVNGLQLNCPGPTQSIGPHPRLPTLQCWLANGAKLYEQMPFLTHMWFFFAILRLF